jgi:hypothetical protein
LPATFLPDREKFDPKRFGTLSSRFMGMVKSDAKVAFVIKVKDHNWAAHDRK